MIGEIKNLHSQKKLTWKRAEGLGLECRYVARFLQGKITREEMLATLEKEIWQYVKRQMTWFKREKNIHWIKNQMEAEKLIKKFL